MAYGYQSPPTIYVYGVSMCHPGSIPYTHPHSDNIQRLFRSEQHARQYITNQQKQALASNPNALVPVGVIMTCKIVEPQTDIFHGSQGVPASEIFGVNKSMYYKPESLREVSVKDCIIGADACGPQVSAKEAGRGRYLGTEWSIAETMKAVVLDRMSALEELAWQQNPQAREQLVASGTPAVALTLLSKEHAQDMIGPARSGAQLYRTSQDAQAYINKHINSFMAPKIQPSDISATAATQHQIFARISPLYCITPAAITTKINLDAKTYEGPKLGNYDPSYVGRHHLSYIPTGLPEVHFSYSHGAQAEQRVVLRPNNETSEAFLARVQQVYQKAWQETHQYVQQAYEKYMDTQVQKHISRDSQSPTAENHRFESNAMVMENDGFRLIERWANALTEKGYGEFAQNLHNAYNQNIVKLQDYDAETKRSAYKAMESVFGKVQREAVKRGDFETATAAQHVVRGAQGALDDMRLGAESQRVGITKEEAAEYGIYVEEEEVCV